jgi:DNA helicase-2/ATP-dependent DNA helicase PcrA
LEQNYRSSGNIVAAALGVIREAPNREEKELWTSAEAGDKVRVHVSRDERDEAAWVIANLQTELARGVAADELAVFYRINAQSRVFEEAFRASKIPYQIIGGMRFFERAEVKDVMSYLRLIENPASDADFLRIVNTPARGIGDRSVEQLIACSGRNQTNLWNALPLALEDGSLPSAACKKLAGFHDLMSTLRADAERLSPAQLAEEVLLRTGYRKLLKDADTPEADARAENIAELVGSLQEFELDCEAAGDVPTLANYLERVSLVADIDASTGGKSVLLMTVHSAKGLEFESVYLTGMEEEVFPYRGLDGKSSEELAEERRLAYVAVTRARKRLQISYAGARTLFGKTRYLAPSRFLSDLPREVCEHDGRPSAVGSYSLQSNYGRSYGGTTPSGRGDSASRFSSNSGGYAGYRAPRKYDEFDQSVPEEVSPGSGSEAFDVTDGATFENLPRLRVNAMRPGMPIAHARFGLGTLRSVSPGEPAKVVATFPGWGEKKILADSVRGVR